MITGSETAFQIYYGALNTGAFIAPLITGVLAQARGWHYGFGFAGFGMLAGLVMYLSGGRDLAPDTVRGARVVRRKLSAKERRVVLVLVLMLPLLTLFWVAQTQIWNTYNLWVRDNVNLAIGSWEVPVPWLQSVDALGVVVLVLPMPRFWRWQAARSSEPDDVTKLAIGCLLFGVAIAWLAAGEMVADATGKVPLVWALVYHFLAAVGYLYFGPVAIAVFSRSAPGSVNAMMIGTYYLSIFAGSTISGRLGALYERLSSAQFWLVHAAIVTAEPIAGWPDLPQARACLL
jgi:POT family proton-dependent oligopeptide transporter